jgi:hypothetical protein
MIIACHILAGAVIADKIQNPVLGLSLAFLSHYIIDIIPHWEYVKNAKASQNQSFTDFLMTFADIILGAAIVLIFSKHKLLAAAGGFIGAAPDFDYFFYTFPSLIKNKFLAKEERFHSKIIHFFDRKKIPFFWRLFSQILVIVISFYFLQQQ